jgi:hypothetical protein
LRYEEFLVLTPQAGAFVRGGQALADGTVRGSSSRLLIEFLLERYELYAHIWHVGPLGYHIPGEWLVHPVVYGLSLLLFSEGMSWSELPSIAHQFFHQSVWREV